MVVVVVLLVVVVVLLVVLVCSQCHWGLKPETLLQRMKVRLGPGRPTTHGKL